VRLYLFLLQDFMLGAGYRPEADDAAALAFATGGSVLELPANVRRNLPSGHTYDFRLTPEQLRTVSAGLGSMYRLMEAPYLVQITLAPTLRKPQSFKVTVLDGQRGKLQVAYPREIVPCTR
jgi:hypothetical protein